MKDKVDRQKMIREVVRDNHVSNQEELAAILEEKGLVVAQATLSRDIRELKISKLHDETGYYYSLSHSGASRAADSVGMMTSDSIVSLEFSGQMAVIKTMPGHANMIASIVDGNQVGEVIGTLAGDDTILLVIREGFEREAVLLSLGKLFKGIETKLI